MRTNESGAVVAGHLNFHHLQYFWAVATGGNLTRTAQALRVSQSAVSAQIRQLEAQLGEPLFHREGRRLVLTEAGAMAMEFAKTIFGAGEELLSTFSRGRTQAEPFRIGAVATLSRNFQESFIRPLLEKPDVQLRITSGGLDDLLGQLDAHALDVVLANRAPRSPARRFRSQRIARQPVSLIGRPRRAPFHLRDVVGQSLLLPGPDSELRAEFDALCERRRLVVQVRAEVDDMATLRLLARDTNALALLPPVVVRDELRAGTLAELVEVPGLFENFYAITMPRRFPHPLTRELVEREEAEMLEMGPRFRRGK
jgi:LysR family transcriptional activator of nhaA